MSATITVTEAARNFAAYINRVAFGGERFVLTRGRRAVAELRPVPAGMKLSELADLLETLPRLGAGDAEAFSADLAEARRELGGPPSGAWAS